VILLVFVVLFLLPILPSFYESSSLTSSNTLGYTKKTTVNGIVFTALAVAFLAGPQIFRDGPYYHKAKSAVIGLWVLSLLLLIVLYVMNTRENKRRDRLRDEGRIENPEGVEFMDLTDKENLNFRYVV
jgi:ACS family allantoate permease-like MFS transporter